MPPPGSDGAPAQLRRSSRSAPTVPPPGPDGPPVRPRRSPRPAPAVPPSGPDQQNDASGHLWARMSDPKRRFRRTRPPLAVGAGLPLGPRPRGERALMRLILLRRSAAPCSPRSGTRFPPAAPGCQVTTAPLWAVSCRALASRASLEISADDGHRRVTSRRRHQRRAQDQRPDPRPRGATRRAPG